MPGLYYCLVCLVPKNGDFNDPLAKTPLFAFPSSEIPWTEIMFAAEDLFEAKSEERCLWMKYAILKAPKVEFDFVVDIFKKDGIKESLLKELLAKYVEQESANKDQS